MTRLLLLLAVGAGLGCLYQPKAMQGPSTARQVDAPLVSDGAANEVTLTDVGAEAPAIAADSDFNSNVDSAAPSVDTGATDASLESSPPPIDSMEAAVVVDTPVRDAPVLIDVPFADGPEGPPCQVGSFLVCGRNNVGVCRLGQHRCDSTNGRYSQECNGAILPGDDVCDGLDNDCDGHVDISPSGEPVCQLDNLPCVPGSSPDIVCGASGQRPCSWGRRVCDAQRRRYGPCTNAVFPSMEVCDLTDNDCDGTADNNIDLRFDPNNCGACGNACAFMSGRGACVNGLCQLLGCSSGYADADRIAANGCECVVRGPELCNGLDDDCDGVVDDGFNFMSDPANCRQCSRTCAFPGGVASCVGGECRLAGCSAGRGDADRDPSNGCECAITGPENCGDRVDNDCDGLIDVSRQDGRLVPCGCISTAIPVNNPNLQGLCPSPPCRDIKCDVDASGVMTMSYRIDCKQVRIKDWGVCEFGIKQNFALFDTAYDGKGLIEVIFCVEGSSMRGGLTLWYGKDPLRRFLRLVPHDQVLGGGCYVRHFTPQQARYPGWEGIPATCANRCGIGDGTCPTDFRATVDRMIAADREGDTSYDYRATRVQLAAESCSDTASGTVKLVSVRYLTDACLCTGSESCTDADRPICRRAEPQDCSWPQGVPSGVCGPLSIGCSGPPGLGAPCSVNVNGSMCSSVTECIEGRYVCAVTGCR